MKRPVISIFLFFLSLISFDSLCMKRARPKTQKHAPHRPSKKQLSVLSNEASASSQIIDAMKRLMEVMPQFEVSGSSNSLIRAMRSKDDERIQSMLTNEYDFITGETALGNALLRWALINDYDAILRIIVNRGIDPNHTQLLHCILLRSCSKGYEDIVEKILSYDSIHVDTQDSNKDNALIKAIACRHKKIVRMLLNYYPDNEAKTKMISRATEWAIEHNQLSVAEKLMKLR